MAVTEVAESIGGMGSDLGVFRLAKDVLASERRGDAPVNWDMAKAG